PLVMETRGVGRFGDVHPKVDAVHQWLPDELRVEKGFSPDTIKLLEQRGQKVAVKEAMGSTQSIMVGPDGALFGASDPRSVDDLSAGVLMVCRVAAS
ncbi:gamma-glutamyltransferase, partial [Enterobacter asburiae]|uniref:gamma-glutamyltransferase n=1 Tax=Enterobacter asburiae TaxID=61645 RepID=UPI0032AEF615